jgi:hypothetical protein
MYSLLFLPAMVLVVLKSSVWWTRRSARLASSDASLTFPKSATNTATLPKPQERPGRFVKRISIGQFTNLLEVSRDLIIIDLREGAGIAPVPVPAAFALHVSPNQLVDVLEWIPANRSVAFCGASNLNIFMNEASSCRTGAAPLYLLERDLYCAEVA